MRSIRQIFPHEFFEHGRYFRALALASIYLLLIVTQLFSYEDFFAVMKGYGLPGGAATTVLPTGLLPLLEVVALPYLLSMRLSRRAWEISRAGMIAAPLLWLCVYVISLASGQQALPAGIFGATLPLPLTWWMAAFVCMILVSALVVARELRLQKGA